MKNNDRLRILLVGPLPPPLGGTTVLFNQLVTELSTRLDVDVKVINTSCHIRGSLFGNVFRGIKVLFNMLSVVPKSDIVSFHAPISGVFSFGFIVWVVCKIYRKPWIVRFFGGPFDQVYTLLPKMAKLLLRKTALNSDLCLFETKSLVQFASKFLNNNVAWYPNSRPLVTTNNMEEAKRKRSYARRFVFIGDVIPTKGIREIIAAGEQLNTEITVDIYGPLRGDITERDFAGLRVVKYCGILDYHEVIPTLSTYDALLLPSYGEGYSGVILEGYAAGIPVISTRCGGTPEIVDETSGILIEPKSSEQLITAMKKLITDKQLYQTLCRGVEEKRIDFSSEKWTSEFVEICRMVLSKNSQTRKSKLIRNKVDYNVWRED